MIFNRTQVRLLVGALALTLMGIGIVSCGDDDSTGGFQVTPVENESAIGSPAPAFNLKDVDGNDISIEQFRGKLVLIDFWGSWCPPCRREMADLRETYARFKDRDFVMLGISYQDRFDEWKQMIADSSLAWFQAYDPTGATAIRYGSEGAVPYKVFVDEEGNVLDMRVSRHGLSERIETELNK